MKRMLFGLISCCALGAYAQMQMPHQPQPSDDPQSQPQLDLSTEAMSHHHEDMGPHMKMSTLREPQPGDQERAAQIVKEARSALEKYQDYHVAEKDDYKIFAPNAPGKMKHFTNYSNAIEAAFTFDPKAPTSLLYQKTGDGGYKLIGAMYTAPRGLTEDQLNKRVPLSVAQWHQHVNLCLPPKGQRQEMFRKNAKFGLQGSITTPEACDAAGGTFKPVVFGWMVHFYPWEKTQDEIWSVERQAPKHQMEDMKGMDMSH